MRLRLLLLMCFCLFLQAQAQIQINHDQKHQPVKAWQNLQGEHIESGVIVRENEGIAIQEQQQNIQTFTDFRNQVRRLGALRKSKAVFEAPATFFDRIEKRFSEENQRTLLPILVANIDYQAVDPDVWQPVGSQSTYTAVTPWNHFYANLSVPVALEADQIINNTADQVTGLELRWDSGAVFLHTGETTRLNFEKPGKYLITANVMLDSGAIQTSTFELKVADLGFGPIQQVARKIDLDLDGEPPLIPNLCMIGLDRSRVEGLVEDSGFRNDEDERIFVSPALESIVVSTRNDLLRPGGVVIPRNPVVLIEGWDEEDSRDVNYYLEQMHDAGILEPLLNSNRDLVFVNYEHVGVRIEAQAKVATQVLEMVWQMSEGLEAGFDLIGVSMGGLVATHAIVLGETDPSLNVNYRVRRLMTIDSPHGGAYIPESIYRAVQQLSIASDVFGDPLAFWEQINFPNSRQMSIRGQYTGDNMRTEFRNLHQDRLNQVRDMDIRMVALVNGHWAGGKQRDDIQPGDLLLEQFTDDGIPCQPEYDIFAQNRQTTNSPAVRINICFLEDQEVFQDLANQPWLENTPGGRQTFFDSFVNALVRKGYERPLLDNAGPHTFVPTMSAAGIDPGQNRNISDVLMGDLTAYELQQGRPVDGHESPFDYIIHSREYNTEHAFLGQLLRYNNLGSKVLRELGIELWQGGLRFSHRGTTKMVFETNGRLHGVDANSPLSSADRLQVRHPRAELEVSADGGLNFNGWVEQRRDVFQMSGQPDQTLRFNHDDETKVSTIIDNWNFVFKLRDVFLPEHI